MSEAVRRRSRLARLFRAEAGTSLVEFSLVASGMLLFVFGIIELGRMLWIWEALQATAADTARCGAINSSVCPASATCTGGSGLQCYSVTAAQSRGIPGFTGSDTTVTSNATCGGLSGFTKIQVRYVFHTVVPAYIPASSTTLTATACYPNNS